MQVSSAGQSRARSAEGSIVTRILIIEDEEPMAEAIKYSLENDGIEAEVATDGGEGWRLFEEGGFDLLILDLMLPVIDGLEICRRVRQAGDTPVLILTAKCTELDRVLGLELGADDYVTKPFSMRELMARVKVILRRASRTLQELDPVALEAGDVSIDLERHEVIVRGAVVDLPPVEYRLLELFLKNSGKLLARDYLISAGWRGEFYGQNKNLDVHIRRLRERIEEDPARPRRIVTVRGLGYRYEPCA